MLKYVSAALPRLKMKTLVLCVDRDDDLGTKAGINGPVIGRDR